MAMSVSLEEVRTAVVLVWAARVRPCFQLTRSQSADPNELNWVLAVDS